MKYKLNDTVYYVDKENDEFILGCGDIKAILVTNDCVRYKLTTTKKFKEEKYLFTVDQTEQLIDYIIKRNRQNGCI